MAKNRIIYYTQDGRVKYKAVTAGAGYSTVISSGSEGSKVVGISVSAVTGTQIIISFNDGAEQVVYDQTLASDFENEDILNLMSAPKNAGGSKYINIPTGVDIKFQSVTHNATIMVALEDY